MFGIDKLGEKVITWLTVATALGSAFVWVGSVIQDSFLETVDSRIEAHTSVVIAEVNKQIAVQGAKYLLLKSAHKVSIGRFDDVSKVTLEHIFFYEDDLLKLRPSLRYELTLVREFYNKHFRSLGATSSNSKGLPGKD